MENLDISLREADDINRYSQEIISNVNDLKVSLTGFLVNQNNQDAYKDAYKYLVSVLRAIGTIEDSAVKINWTNADIMENLLNWRTNNVTDRKNLCKA